MPIVMPSVSRPALTEPTYLAPAAWKLVPAWLGLGLGALVLMTAAATLGDGVRGALAMALFGLAMALVGGWWLWCESRDRKHADEDHFLDAQAVLAQRAMAGYVAADALSPLTWDTPLTPFARRWPLVGSTAFALFAAALLLMPTAEATPTPAPAANPVPTANPKPVLSTITATTTATTTAPAVATPTQVEPQRSDQQADDRRREAPAPAPVQSAYYPNCSAVRAAGAAPLLRGEPGYASKLDRDNDGVACE